jgi:hypothetical protein
MGWRLMRTAVGVPTITQKRAGLFASRLTIYICVLLLSVLVATVYKFRTDTIFACQADGYSADRYVAYCNGANFADYEHGAFAFDIEPSAQNFARNAEMLFLGNSHLEVAFSTDATANWFSGAGARYYLLGFSYHENMLFSEKILDRMQPKARVYLINVDDFFVRTETPPMQAISHDPQARQRYEEKRRWQFVHEAICGTFPFLCGNAPVIFRSRETGAFTKRTDRQNIVPVSYDQVIDQKAVDDSVAAAKEFLSHLPPQSCVILTTVPTVGTKIGNANAIARGVDLDLVTPGNLGDLRTYDGSHLDRQSAERWSQAFLQAAGSRIQACLEKQGSVRP